MTEPTLLIVDDDPGTCETLSDIFQEKGCTVATATTGREAQDKAKQTAFNVALIDI
jgi:CheY-like chemotaxis protein